MSDPTEGNGPGEAPEAEHGIEIDIQTRMVTVSYRRPLDIQKTEIEIPFAVWKATSAVIMNHEANLEQVALSGDPSLWVPGGDPS